MNQIATITSKKQLTLPSKIFRQAGFKIGDKVLVSEENGSLKITPAVRLVESLAGSVPVPEKWKGKDIDEMIEEAKDEYFREKHGRK